MNDLPLHLHRLQYGKSDKVNAHENSSEEFQKGFCTGLTDSPLEDSGDLIEEEFKSRCTRGFWTDKDHADFKEWKRGMWAARIQKAWMTLKHFKEDDE